MEHTEEFYNLMKQDNLKMYGAIVRVRELHKPVDIDDLGSWIVCEGCSNQFIDDEAPYVNYPCATIKALDGETNE